MDMTPQFTVFIGMIVAALVEIPVLFALLHLLGVRKYGDASLASVTMWAGLLMVAEFYGGWRLMPLVEDVHLAWVITIPVALLAAGIMSFVFSLPLSRAIMGGFIFFGLHFWIVPLLPQPKDVEPTVIVAKSDATASRPSYHYDDSPPEYVQWYSQVKSWEETRINWGSLLDQLETLFTNQADDVQLEQLTVTMGRASEDPRMEVLLDGTALGLKRSDTFKAFLNCIPRLELSNALLEEVTLDRFGPDIRVGSREGVNQFCLRGNRYFPRPPDHDAMATLSRGAVQLALGRYDDWMRPTPGQRRSDWIRKRAERIVSAGKLPVTEITPLKAAAGIPEQSGGHFINALVVNLHMTASYPEIVRALKQFEGDTMIGWVYRLDLHRDRAMPGQFLCDVDIGWPWWGNREMEIKVARFLGKKIPPPVFDGPTEIDDEQYMRRMQERNGYIPAPYQ